MQTTAEATAVEEADTDEEEEEVAMAAEVEVTEAEAPEVCLLLSEDQVACLFRSLSTHTRHNDPSKHIQTYEWTIRVLGCASHAVPRLRVVHVQAYSHLLYFLRT